MELNEEAVNDVADADDNVTAETEENSAEEVQGDESNDDTEDKSGGDNGKKDDGYIEFPKKAKNAISNRDKKIAKLRAENQQLVEQMRQFQSKSQESVKQTDAPKEEDFDNYGDFLKASILHELNGNKEKPQEGQVSAQEQQLMQQKAMYVQQKQQGIVQKAQEYSKVIPDYQEVFNENAEILDYLPEHVEMAFYESPDAALAFYNLAKNGQLGDLLQANPYQAMGMIAQASTMPAMPKKQPPPRPLSGVKGAGKASKSLGDMSPDEIAAKFGI